MSRPSSDYQFSRPLRTAQSLLTALSVLILSACAEEESEHIYPAEVIYSFYRLHITAGRVSLEEPDLLVRNNALNLKRERHSLSDQNQITSDSSVSFTCDQVCRDDPYSLNGDYQLGGRFTLTTTTPIIDGLSSEIDTAPLPEITYPMDGDTFTPGTYLSIPWNADSQLVFAKLTVTNCQQTIEILPDTVQEDVLVMADGTEAIFDNATDITNIYLPEELNCPITLQLVMEQTAEVNEQFAGGKLSALLYSPVITLQPQ